MHVLPGDANPIAWLRRFGEQRLPEQPALLPSRARGLRAVEPSPLLGDDLGVVTFQLVGVKGLSSTAAVKTYGADLFLKENDKKDRGKEKIAAKIFEIERRLLVKRRPRP